MLFNVLFPYYLSKIVVMVDQVCNLGLEVVLFQVKLLLLFTHILHFVSFAGHKLGQSTCENRK